MSNLLWIDGGGRKERSLLIKKGLAPNDFLQGLEYIKKRGYSITHLSSRVKYKRSFKNAIASFFEQLHSRVTGVGLRPFVINNSYKLFSEAKIIASFIDGFSLTIGLYYSINDKPGKILIGCFHRLSDYKNRVPYLLWPIYYRLLKKSLNRLNHIAFYGPGDRDNAIQQFKIKKEKTSIILFGVDTNFWIPSDDINQNEDYIFSIGQDPARDFPTLIKANINKHIKIHTSQKLTIPKDKINVDISFGSYQKTNKSLSDLELLKLYQNSFAVVVPLKDVYQPSGYSVTLQALACGKPVILTKTKGLWAPEILINHKNCLLIPAGSSKAIELAIEKLNSESNFYKKLCKEARLTALKYFNNEKASESTLNIIERCKSTNLSLLLDN